MKLETKHGVLEGTVEEFKDLLEDKKDLSYFSGEAEEDIKPTYKIVNKDTIDYNSGVRIFKGIVLEHVSRDWYTTKSMYTDTMGNLYQLHESDLDDYNMSWVDVKFRTHKDKSLLLVQKEEENKSDYYTINNDTIDDESGVRIPKGLVLKHLIGDRYLDTTGNKYLIDDKDLDDCNMPWVDDKFKSFKDKDLLLIQKNQF